MTESKTTQFSFPEELVQLNWIQKHTGDLEQSALDKTSDFREYLSGLRKRSPGDDPDEGGAYDGDSLRGAAHHTGFGNVAGLLNKTSFCTYLEDFDGAREHLEDARKAVADMEDEKWKLPEDSLAAVKYCLEAADWAIRMLNFHNADDEDQEKLLVEGGGFNQKFKDVQKNDISYATIKFLEGFLVNGMKAKHEITLELYEAAAKLDPGNHLWHHYAYRKGRKIRRNFKVGPEKRWVPGQEEKQHCQKAYELRPDYLPIVIDYSQLLKEGFWTGNEAVWKERADDVRKCEGMFKEALRLALQDDTSEGKFWLGKVKLYYGEFLLFGKGRGLDQKFGKQLFDECIEAYPSSSFVLHKVGKLCHLGAFGTQLFKDVKKAEEYYKRALQHESNFPCLRDYQKLLMEDGKFSETIELIDKFMEVCKRDDHVVRLMMERGCLQFLHGPVGKEEVCKNWIEILVKYPSYREDGFDAFKRKYGVNNDASSYVSKPSVLEVLLEMKVGAEDAERCEAVASLTSELIRQEEERKKRWNQNNQRGRNELVDGMQQMRLDSSSSVGRQRGRGGWGLRGRGNGRGNSNFGSSADKDGNWRKFK